MKQNVFVLGILAFAISGCSSKEDDFAEIVKCNLSAEKLNQSQAMYEINISAHKFSEDSGYVPKPEDAVRMGLKIREDLDLDKLNATKTEELMLKIYNSSACKKMHKQPELES
ncbi:hypothetical protein [Pseudomonas sp. BF-R-01]|uniref:hypothetical protein n=1 Tax=Pseudomonas sp. BF-R-01 TaxID=2832365 RepID=UPI001CBA96B5|nr:hypothetical protein [Pseudomonas sp. BF-R-01]